MPVGRTDFEELLTRLPWSEKWTKELSEFSLLLLNRRQPRIAVIGRKGSGKSALFSALLGSCALFADATRGSLGDAREAAYPRSTVRWTDATGLGAETDEERLLALQSALRAEPPDLVLVLREAGCLETGVEEEVHDVEALLALLSRARSPVPKLLGVVTKVDEIVVAAPEATQDEFEEMRAGVAGKAAGELRALLEGAGLRVTHVIPVAADQVFSEGRRIRDGRWNLALLAEAVVESLPEAAQVEAARAIEPAGALRRRFAVRIVGASTSLALLIGATPLPIGDLLILLPLQAVMLTSITYVSARDLRRRVIVRMLGGMGGSAVAALGLREGMRALAKLVPGVGLGVAGAVAASGTWAMGMAAIRLFIDRAATAGSLPVVERTASVAELTTGAPDAPASEARHPRRRFE